MKKIKTTTYESLNPEQRLVATIEASGRGDDDEVQRLFSTCPRKTYTQTDAAFANKHLLVVTVAMAIELELASIALSAFMSIFHQSENFKAKIKKTKRFEDMKAEEMHQLAAMLEAIAAMDAAAARWFEAKGISRENWIKFRPKRHLVVDFWANLAPEPSEDDVQHVLEQFAEIEQGI